ncbi:hypothetical protein JOB18_037699 [Solea senegalensis]|uniref:Uncharacterized protein n=1 Tax=Solea senegalensis TaxID=28829 RepID=A0AAV6SBU2_SOLSE|nr:hypothetical protein JOB18_037699 [Solea senegalensis]
MITPEGQITIQGPVIIAGLEIKLTSSGELSNGTIVELVKEFLRDQLLNGTAHTVNVRKIQRVVVGP